MLRKAFGVLFVGVVIIALYLAFSPVPIDPVGWEAPKDAGYAGPHAVNTRLSNLRQLSLGAESGPEHVVLAADGFLHVAVAQGKILRMKPDGSAMEVWANTGGRVLGFDFNQHGDMIAADSRRGLLLIEARGNASSERRITVLADKVRIDGADDPIRFADAVVVAPDGKIYFTDASRRFGAARWGEFDASILDILERSATGRVLVYDPVGKGVEVVATGLSFANGLALSADGRSLFVAETGKYRIWKLARTVRHLHLMEPESVAKSSGDAVVVIANLPGYPDNLMRGKNGRIWVGLAKPRSTSADNLASKPFMTKLAVRLPRALWPVPPPTATCWQSMKAGK